MFYLSLRSQRKVLSCNINYMIRYEEVFKLGACKFEKLLFSIYFLNWDILLNIFFRITKSSTAIDKIHMEGTMSQIFYIGPSFCFMKCRK